MQPKGNTCLSLSSELELLRWQSALRLRSNGAANAAPMEGEVDWAVPQKRPGHTAKVSHNLPETTKSVVLSILPC